MTFTRRMRQASAGNLGSISALVTPSFTAITVDGDTVHHAFSPVAGATLYRIETELVA